MRIIVLGSAAGGGFPQWNSDAPSCRRARSNDPAARPRTQTSLAISSNDRDWFIINASPDLRLQIEQAPALHPGPARRSSPIAGVILANGDVDAVAGLLHLREGHRFTVYGPERVLAALTKNPIFRVLAPDLVRRVALPLDRALTLGEEHENTGLTVEAFAVPGKPPLYLEDEYGVTSSESGFVVGLAIHDLTSGGDCVFVPGCFEITPDLVCRIVDCDLLFFDGTFWRDDEMIALGIGSKTAARMGHVTMSGPNGAIVKLAQLGIRRRIFIHINNSNPAMIEDSPERRELEAAGWEVAFDGMELAQ